MNILPIYNSAIKECITVENFERTQEKLKIYLMLRNKETSYCYEKYNNKITSIYNYRRQNILRYYEYLSNMAIKALLRS